MRTSSSLILVVAACSSPSRPAPSAPPPPTVVEWEVHGQEGPGGSPGATPGGDPGSAPSGAATPVAPAPGVDRTRPQPPEVKLKLGHFTDAKHNIGLIIDRTNKEARVRFDHVPQVMRLDPMRSSGRIDYVRTINQVVLQVYDNGHVVVFVPGTSESIDVVRDGDADPL
jgi:hypothetical protein